MLGLRPADSGRRISILAVGAHADDLEIGCAGTLISLRRRYRELQVHWFVAGCADDERAREAASSARMLLGDEVVNVTLGRYLDAFLPYEGGRVKRHFEALKAEVDPDLIFTHYRHDLHQDHRLISELTWNTFRDHLILEYEIPKYDGDLGSPNVFVHLDEATAERKIEHVRDHFTSQATRAWFTDDLFRALLRIRGMESNSPSGLAEAFYARKLVLDTS